MTGVPGNPALRGPKPARPPFKPSGAPWRANGPARDTCEAAVMRGAGRVSR